MFLGDIIDYEFVDNDTEIIIRNDDFEMIVCGRRHCDDILEFCCSKIISFTLQNDNKLYIDLEVDDDDSKVGKWRVIHECDSDDGTPNEWAYEYKIGYFIWIDRDEDGFSVIGHDAVSKICSFDRLYEAIEYVENDLCNEEYC